MKLKHFATISIAPVLSLGLLLGMSAQASRHIKPADVEPFHQQAKTLIASYPYYVGTWVGQDEPVTKAAVQLLHPNEILSRRYTNTSPSGPLAHAGFQMLIVQTRDSRDMLGHYPPVCYPAHGQTLASQKPRDWQTDAGVIHGMEYHFSYHVPGAGEVTRVVYNFLIIPGQRTARSMDTVLRAAEDYQERYYGAAQFQFVFPGAIPQTERDSIFIKMIDARPDLIKALESGGIHAK
jgi:hypothetical protein